MREHADERDFEEWSRSAWTYAVSFAARRVGDAAAPDVVQEALIVAYRHWHGLDTDPIRRRNWLLRVVQGKAKDYRRSSERSANREDRYWDRTMPQHVDPIEELTSLQLAAEVAKLAGASSEADAELVLMLWEGLGPTEIANISGISANAASARIHKLRARLRDAGGREILEGRDG